MWHSKHTLIHKHQRELVLGPAVFELRGVRALVVSWYLIKQDLHQTVGLVKVHLTGLQDTHIHTEIIEQVSEGIYTLLMSESNQTVTGVLEISLSLRMSRSTAALLRASVCSHRRTLPCSDTSTCQPSDFRAITAQEIHKRSCHVHTKI